MRRDVLIVDDDPLITRMLARVLKGHHAVRFVHCPGDAITEIERRAPDVLLCDYQLECGTTAALLCEVKARWPRVRCVLHSASRMELWAGLVTGRIVDQVLLKPSSIREILASLSGGVSGASEA